MTVIRILLHETIKEKTSKPHLNYQSHYYFTSYCMHCSICNNVFMYGARALILKLKWKIWEPQQWNGMQVLIVCYCEQGSITNGLIISPQKTDSLSFHTNPLIGLPFPQQGELWFFTKNYPPFVVTITSPLMLWLSCMDSHSVCTGHHDLSPYLSVHCPQPSTYDRIWYEGRRVYVLVYISRTITYHYLLKLWTDL
jgi:hypothetical protein